MGVVTDCSEAFCRRGVVEGFNNIAEMTTKGASRSAATAMAIAGRASRACDVCASKSARWYCGADRAYLCDKCDTQVHSANALARRHERHRLTPSGVAMQPARKPAADLMKDKTFSQRKHTISKKTHASPVQVLPPRKRSRTSRPHPHRQAQHITEATPASKLHNAKDVEVEDEFLTVTDAFDTEDFLVDDTQEVPSLITVAQDSSPSSSELDLSSDFSPELNSDAQGGSSSPSSDSFVAYFKGKAAQDDCFSDDVMSDQFLVPDAFDDGINICCDMDGNISLAGDACFISGDIPGLDGFEDFGSRELSNNTYSFDLALRDSLPGAFEGDGAATSDARGTSLKQNVVGVENDQFSTGPFANFFAKNRKSETVHSSPENIKNEAKEILRCCLEGLTEEDMRTVPSLRLNYEDVITAWSDRGEPWVNPENFPSEATDVGLVPDMGQGGADDGHGGREARVMRYKAKRRSRLFSKKIRYEVRKLNAEKRPRMKVSFPLVVTAQ